MADAHESRKAVHAIETLLKLAHYVELRDHVRGRIETRVSFSDIPKVLALLQELDADGGLQLIPGLMDYEVSAWSRSATINYDPSILPGDLWDDFCAVSKNPSLEETVRERLYAVFENHPATVV